MNEPRNEGCSVTVALPGLHRQLHRLSEIYWQHSEYYRAALRPTIAGLVERIKEART